MSIRKYNDFLKEGLDDSWSKGDITITLRQVLDVTKDIPITKIPTSKLEYLALHKDNPNEQEKIKNSDLQYPVLILVNDDNSIKYVLDGHHRIQKAIMYKLPTINVKFIKFNELPDNFKKVLK